MLKFSLIVLKQETILKILILIKGVKMKSRIITETFAVDSAIQLPRRSILRHMIFKETTRQRDSKSYKRTKSKD